MNLISLPLIPFSNALEDVISSQLAGADNEAASDRIWVVNGYNYEFALAGGRRRRTLRRQLVQREPTIRHHPGRRPGAFVQIREGHGPRRLSIVCEVADYNRHIPLRMMMTWWARPIRLPWISQTPTSGERADRIGQRKPGRPHMALGRQPL